MAKAKKVRGGGAVVSGPPEVRRVRAAGPRDLWAEVKQEEKSAWSEHWRPVTAKERDAARSNALAKRQMYVPPAAAAAAEVGKHIVVVVVCCCVLEALTLWQRICDTG